MANFDEMIAKLQAAKASTVKKVTIIEGVELEVGAASALDMLRISGETDPDRQAAMLLAVASFDRKLSMVEAEALLDLIPAEETLRVLQEVAAAMGAERVLSIAPQEAFLENTPPSAQPSEQASDSADGLTSSTTFPGTP